MATDKRTHGLASKRLRNQELSCTSADRISDLPDSLLLLILSFLPAPDVVRTCILSRRWQHVWTFVPCLDFGYDINYIGFWGSAYLVKFVNRFLLQYKGSSIHKFKVASYVADYCDAESWMRWAIDRNVKELELIFPHLSLHLPRTTFGSRNLVVLKLSSLRLSMTTPPSARIPCLKTLELDSPLLSDGEFDNALISCCMVLENLSIRRSYCSELKILRVYGRQLKHLGIDLNETFEINRTGTGCVIDINAPTLKDLKITVRGSCSLLLENVGTLSKAEIDLNDSKAFQSLIKFFHALDSVKSLCLSSRYTKQVCNLELRHTFHSVNLTHLTLGVRSVWAQLLPYFFLCLPNLEVLSLNADSPDGYHGTGKLCVDPQLLPTCVLSRLRVFEAEEFRETPGELSLLKYILKTGKVLGLVRIRHRYSNRIAEGPTTRKGTKAREFEEKFLKCEEERRELVEKFRVAQMILSFPRASQKCEIKFS